MRRQANSESLKYSPAGQDPGPEVLEPGSHDFVCMLSFSDEDQETSVTIGESVSLSHDIPQSSLIEVQVRDEEYARLNNTRLKLKICKASSLSSHLHRAMSMTVILSCIFGHELD